MPVTDLMEKARAEKSMNGGGMTTINASSTDVESDPTKLYHRYASMFFSCSYENILVLVFLFHSFLIRTANTEPFIRIKIDTFVPDESVPISHEILVEFVRLFSG
jgi:hypothetical protein